MATILVTGGTGFVGSNLANRLSADGHKVIITGVQTEQNPNLPMLTPGLCGIDFDRLPDIDVLFHQAANNDTMCHDVDEMIWANVTCARHLFNVCLEAGCKQFVYASSTAVYGAEPSPYIEGVTALKPLNPYGESKKLFELEADLFGKMHKVNVVGLRYCNIYGPGESHKGTRMSMIGQMAKQIREGWPVRLFEFGEQRRDYIHVEDVVQANLAAMKFQGQEIFNIGSGTSASFLDIFDFISKNHPKLSPSSNIKPEWIKNPRPETYQNLTQCDIKKAATLLGWQPSVSIQEGIKHYLTSCFSS
jgi:ADP-L-glycero-D-manno-heptose 6-epimerase